MANQEKGIYATAETEKTSTCRSRWVPSSKTPTATSCMIWSRHTKKSSSHTVELGEQAMRPWLPRNGKPQVLLYWVSTGKNAASYLNLKLLPISHWLDSPRPANHH